jgi:tetratricopeptide (TPR) repeat protein
MGFSLQQARLALAATLQSGATAGTDSQWDVQAAVEVLASDGAANAERARSPRSAKNTTTKTSIGDRKLQQGFQDDEMDEYERKEARRAQGRAKERGAEGSHRRGSPSVSPGVIDRQSDDQSPDLLAQASSIGFSVLKSANAYWKTSKAQIAKAVEENKFLAATTDRAGSGRTTPNTGRPKWMTADVEDGETGERPAARSDVAKGKMPQQPSFSDTDGGHAEVPQIRGARQRSDSPPQRKQQPVANLWDEAVDVLAPHPSDRPAAKSHEVSQPKPHLKPPEKEKVAYVSPHRRKAPTPSPSSNTPSSNGLNTAHFRNGASKPTPRPQIPTRAKVTATHSQLAASKDARTRGNEHFKLGRYGEAVEAYTAALTPLPDNHLGRIPALNNRANARLKIGEERKAGEDATAVITLLLADSAKPDAAKKDDYTAVLAELEGTETSAGEERLDAHDALGKALSRRARGHEAGEKWRLAMLDWQMLAELGDQRVLKSGGGMRVVSEGLARCRKVVEGPVEPIQKVQAKPPAARVPSKPRAASSAPTAKPSAALTALRQGNQQAEADESEAIRVKDNVDAKITSWRAGKETNLRALIGSLDNVLWEELGWKKVGMHELLTESQLKVKYVRAISKVHPDKVKLSQFLLLRYGAD